MKCPIPWVHYSAPLRPNFPTKIHEIHDANGEVVIAWGGFDALNVSDKQRGQIADRIVRAVNEYDDLKATVSLPLKHARMKP